MANGFSHVGVSTHDMDSTIRFYEDVLGFRRQMEDLTRIKEGGTLRQVYFDAGNGQYIVFMEPRDIMGIPSGYDTGINGALGVPGGMYHFAYKVLTIEDLESWRCKLESHGIEVSQIIDLGHAKSIFFTDPNELQLEMCCQTRQFREPDLHKESEASIALPIPNAAD